MEDNSRTHQNTSLNTASLHNPSLDIPLDDDGHLVDYLQWSPEVAQKLASTLSVVLTNEHYEVLTVVRQFFESFQHSPATRPLIKYLQQQLPDRNITNEKLQQMFATGLVARHVNRISGLPKPPNCL